MVARLESSGRRWWVLVVVDSGQRRIPPGLGIGIPVANWNSP